MTTHVITFDANVFTDEDGHEPETIELRAQAFRPAGWEVPLGGDAFAVKNILEFDVDPDEPTIELEATGVGDWCWHVGVRHPDLDTVWERFFYLTADANFVDLVDLDPYTLDPAVAPAPAWAAGLADETARATAAEEDLAAEIEAEALARATDDIALELDIATETADRIAQAATFQKKPNADSWPIYLYGNSYAVLAAAYFTAGNHYTEQLAAALGGGAATSYGIGGKRILDVNAALRNQAAYPGLITAPLAGSLWPGVSARNGLIVLDAIVNDIGHYATMVGVPVPAVLVGTKYLDQMTLAYRDALAWMTSESRIEQSASSATSGVWTNNSPTAYASGSSISWTTANGAYKEYSVTPPQSGPMRGIVFVHGLALATELGFTMAQQTISVDGVAQITRTPTAWEQYTGPTGVAVTMGPDCYAVTVPVDGAAHTIRIAHSGTAGHLMYIDAISIPSIDPNPIAVMGGEHAVAYSAWSAAQRNIYHGNAKAIIPVVKAVVAEFPHAFYVPSTITPNGLYSADGLHPNDRGMAQRANDLQTAITSAIRARLESRRLSNLADANFPIV